MLIKVFAKGTGGSYGPVEYAISPNPFGKGQRQMNPIVKKGDPRLMMRQIDAVLVEVDGDIQVFSNRGAIRVSRNRVDGNLQCKENRNRPSGSGNRVRGNKEDQCARL